MAGTSPTSQEQSKPITGRDWRTRASAGCSKLKTFQDYNLPHDQRQNVTGMLSTHSHLSLCFWDVQGARVRTRSVNLDSSGWCAMISMAPSSVNVFGGL